MAQEYMYICTELSPSNYDNSVYCKHWKLVPSDEFFDDDSSDDLLSVFVSFLIVSILAVIFLILFRD